LRPQRADGGVAYRVRRQARDVVALAAVVRQAHGDVGPAAAERGDKLRRLQQALEPRGAQAPHDFSEADGLHSCSHTPRAALTLATSVLALAAMTSKRPSSIALASSRALPTPTAHAPALIHSPALVSETPPVGSSLTCGSGAFTSLM